MLDHDHPHGGSFGISTKNGIDPVRGDGTEQHQGRWLSSNKLVLIAPSIGKASEANKRATGDVGLYIINSHVCAVLGAAQVEQDNHLIGHF